MGAQLETDSGVEWGGGAREECVLCVPGIGSFKWILSELKQLKLDSSSLHQKSAGPCAV